MPDYTNAGGHADHSDYAAIGGADAVKKSVDRFYELVFADERLAPYFTGVDETRLKRHQAMLVSQLLGGPQSYAGQTLDEAHAGMNITEEDFTRVVGHFADTLAEMGASSEIIDRAGEALVGFKADIVSGSTRGPVPESA